MKERGFSTISSLLIVFAMNAVILSFVLTTGIFLKSSLHRDWMVKSRSFQEKSIKEILEIWFCKIKDMESYEKFFESGFSEKGKEKDFYFETTLSIEKSEQVQEAIPFKFSVTSRTFRGNRESRTIAEGEGKLFSGQLPFSLFPLFVEVSDFSSDVKIISGLLPKAQFSSLPFSLKLNLSDEIKEKIERSGEGIFYFDFLDFAVLFVNQDVEKIHFSREWDFQWITLRSEGKEVSLRMGRESSIFKNSEGELISSKPCKLIMINGKIDSISSSFENVLISGIDLTIISSGSIKIDSSIDGENSLLGICSVGLDILSGEEREGYIKISERAVSIRASLLACGKGIEIEGDLIVKGSIHAKRIQFKNLTIITQEYLLSGLSPTFYPLTSEEMFFIGQLNILDWREK